MHWAKDFYEFTEGDLLTEVELVTQSAIEVDQVIISGLPRQIPNEHKTHIAPILVPGPSILGTYNALAEQAWTKLVHATNFDTSLHSVYIYFMTVQFVGFSINASIEQVKFRGAVYGNAQVTRKFL